jgi:hypothetical protein
MHYILNLGDLKLNNNMHHKLKGQSTIRTFRIVIYIILSIQCHNLYYNLHHKLHYDIIYHNGLLSTII